MERPKFYTTEYGTMGYIPGKGYVLFKSEEEYLEIWNSLDNDEEEPDADQN